ncbi:MAG: hypothetical protein ACRDSL_27300 [Pseudonocardiaceae bacterium]
MSTDPTTAQFCYDGFYVPGRLAALLDALDGVTITDAERRTLAWLSGWERHTVDNLAALIRRARAAVHCPAVDRREPEAVRERSTDDRPARPP